MYNKTALKATIKIPITADDVEIEGIQLSLSQVCTVISKIKMYAVAKTIESFIF